jgi:hypothetical protein
MGAAFTGSPYLDQRRPEGRGRQAGKYPAVVALASAGLLVTGTSGQLGIDGPHVSQDRDVRRGSRADQAEVCTQLAHRTFELGCGELPDIVVAGHAISKTQ